MEFILLKSFETNFSKAKMTDEDLRSIQNEIVKNPEVGDIEPGVNGVRKLRYASTRDKGKSGGSRVHYIILNNICYLFAFVPKNVAENLTKEQRNKLAKLVSGIKKLKEMFISRRRLQEMSRKTYYDYLNEGLQDLYDYLNGNKSKGRKSQVPIAEPMRSESLKLKIKESDFDRYDPNVEAAFMEPGNLYNDMPDDPYDSDIKNKEYFDFVVSDVMNRCKDEKEARRYMTRNGLTKSFINDVIKEIERIYDISESLKEADYAGFDDPFDYQIWNQVSVPKDDKDLYIRGIHELQLDWKLGHKEGSRVGLKIFADQSEMEQLADLVGSYKNSIGESIIREDSSKKSYWKYNLMDTDDDTYYDKRSIKKIKLIPCSNPDDCYVDENGITSWAVCDYEYPYDEVFCTKDEAYDYLLTRLNSGMYEREHDI